ncbi:MAG: class I SAM-dependent methyltransferase [Pirellulales bacterium]
MREVARTPEPFLLSLDGQLPRQGRALDIAGGTGRNALWLARRGLEVTLADISETALRLAVDEALKRGLPLTTRSADLEVDPLPAGPWDLIVSCHFLWRPMYAAALEQLAPGGRLAVVQPTQSNLERHASPSQRFLLANGELPGLASGFTIDYYDEAWRESGRHEAWLLASKP